jgi:hypothetical protein
MQEMTWAEERRVLFPILSTEKKEAFYGSTRCVACWIWAKIIDRYIVVEFGNNHGISILF